MRELSEFFASHSAGHWPDTADKLVDSRITVCVKWIDSRGTFVGVLVGRDWHIRNGEAEKKGRWIYPRKFQHFPLTYVHVPVIRFIRYRTFFPRPMVFSTFGFDPLRCPRRRCRIKCMYTLYLQYVRRE